VLAHEVRVGVQPGFDDLVGQPAGVVHAQPPQRLGVQGLVDHRLVALPLQPLAGGRPEVGVPDHPDPRVPGVGVLPGQLAEGGDRRGGADAVHAVALHGDDAVLVAEGVEERPGAGVLESDDRGLTGRQPGPQERGGDRDQLLR
jgi:hypothetical protein